MMKRAIEMKSILVCIAVIVLGIAQMTVAAVQYNITDLGTLGGADSVAKGINSSGQVAGFSNTASGTTRAFLYSDEVMTDLGTLGGPSSDAVGVGDGGQVAGTSTLAGGSPAHAYIYSGGIMTDLGTLGGTNSYCLGVSANGKAVGFSDMAGNSTQRAFLYSGGVMTNLGTLGGAGSCAFAVNENGQVTGWADTSYGQWHAFLRTGTTMVDLGTLGGVWSWGAGINAAGQVVGESVIPGNAAWHAFLYSGGRIYNLGTLGGTNSTAVGINSSGIIVGRSDTSSGVQHAFVYRNNTMTDLNNLIPPASGWMLSEATGINDLGQIVGCGTIGGNTHAFLLTPIPDTTAPTPNPMTWLVAPHGSGLHSISMTATTANDDSGVQYLFTCTSGGGHSSAWQNSPTYTDTGLAEGQTCSYTVKARDRSPAQNETSPSTPDAFASALADSTAPMPNPITWSAVPAATGLYEITMAAQAATDVSGVEYFFANITDPSHDSGWQDGTTYTDTGLVNNTTYTYRVIARDKSVAQNETAWSDPNSATTPRYLCTGPITTDFDGDCQVDFLDYALLAMEYAIPGPQNLAVNGSFDSDISGWTAASLPYAMGSMTTSFDEVEGNPAGSAKMQMDASLTDVDGHYFYQIIPVESGKQYRLSGDWKGSLEGTTPANPDSVNWIFLFFGFTDQDPLEDSSIWESLAYAKAFGATTMNIGATGSWDWESILTSPYDGPVDGIFTATADHAVIVFGLGGTLGAGASFVNIDNIGLAEVTPCPSYDLSGDCMLDFTDLGLFVAKWLACNRDPATECWQ